MPDTSPNCHACVHRRDIPGDAHSLCAHPVTVVTPGANEVGVLMATLAGKHGDARRKLGITGNPIGIRNGWFMWPANFDPTWLLTCEGFEARAKKETADA